MRPSHSPGSQNHVSVQLPKVKTQSNSKERDSMELRSGISKQLSSLEVICIPPLRQGAINVLFHSMKRENTERKIYVKERKKDPELRAE